VIRIDPTNAKSRNNRGRAYFETKQYDRAIVEYDAALAIDPMFAIAYLNRGLAREAVKDCDGAIDDFAECAGLDPSDVTNRNQLDAANRQRG